MLIRRARSRRAGGFTLIELAITVSVLGFLIMMGLPAMTEWLQNTQIRTAADVAVQGLQTARAEAVQRNSPVRFQYVDTLDAACAYSAAGPHWIISRNDVAGVCDQATVTSFLETNNTAFPQILEKCNAAEGTSNVTVAATDDGAGSSVVTFSSLGRVVNGLGIDTIDFSHPGGTCKANGGALRCMRITVSIGGDIKMCDPAVTAAGDTRRC